MEEENFDITSDTIIDYETEKNRRVEYLSKQKKRSPPYSQCSYCNSPELEFFCYHNCCIVIVCQKCSNRSGSFKNSYQDANYKKRESNDKIFWYCDRYENNVEFFIDKGTWCGDEFVLNTIQCRDCEKYFPPNNRIVDCSICKLNVCNDCRNERILDKNDLTCGQPHWACNCIDYRLNMSYQKKNNILNTEDEAIMVKRIEYILKKRKEQNVIEIAFSDEALTLKCKHMLKDTTLKTIFSNINKEINDDIDHLINGKYLPACLFKRKVIEEEVVFSVESDEK